MTVEKLIKINGKVAKYEITQNHSGQFFIKCQPENLKKKVFIPMISFRNPEREAERLLNNFQLKEGLLAIVFGIASIYLLKKLIKQQAEKGGSILLVEVDIFLINEFVKNLYIVDGEVFILSLENKTVLTDIIENIQIENLLGYRIFKNSVSVQLKKEFYQQMENDIKINLASRFSDLFTRLEFEPRWVINSFSQVILFNKAQPINALFKKGKNLKAILVSSGPSLRSCLPYLKKNSDKFFIACVDSVYRVLHDFGIKPHLIITLDSQAHPIRHFLGLSRGKKYDYPILYSDLVANPQITKMWEGPIFFGITAQYNGNIRKTTISNDYIEKQIKQKNSNCKNGFGDIQSGGSVATSLFDLLRQMCFDQIILMGQDLAYTYREIHCTGTHHTATWISKNTHRLESIENINHKVVKKRSTNYQKSIKGKPIIADYILSLYKQWFEDAGKHNLKLQVLNGTQEGLPINSIPNISLDDIILPKIHPPKKLSNWIKYNTPIATDQIIFDLAKKIISEHFSKEIEIKYPFMKEIGKQHEIKARRFAMNKTSTEQIDNLQLIAQRKKEEVQRRLWQKIQHIFQDIVS